MSEEEKRDNTKLYFSIIQGSLKTTVDEKHPEAETRHWEAAGKKGVKIERTVNALKGIIVDVSFYDGESDGRKFQNLQITLDPNADGKSPVISTSISSRYAQDILTKLPNIDFEQIVHIRPYAFKPNGEDKTVTGVEILQKDAQGKFTKKIENFFYDREKREAKHGYPQPEGDTSAYTTEDWEIYFKQARKFLVNYTREKICPLFIDLKHQTPEPSSEDRKNEADINPDDIPF